MGRFSVETIEVDLNLKSIFFDQTRSRIKMGRFSVIISSIVVIWLYGFSELGLCREDSFIRMKLEGVHDCKGNQNSAEMARLALFAVQEHNRRENTLLEFARLLKIKEQVVAGKIYYLTLEAVDAGKKKIYEAKVLVKPWMNFKQLQDFKHVEDDPSFTLLDIAVKQDGHELGWKAVPTNDPEVQAAANHAIKSIQQRSNSLSPYVLLEILLAKVHEDYAKFELLLKLKRGIKEEKLRVEVIKNSGGKFYLNQMEHY